MLSSVVKGIVGLGQLRKGKKLQKALGDRPDYEVPQGVLTSAQVAERNANLGGVSNLGQEQLNQIDQGVANTIAKQQAIGGSGAELLQAANSANVDANNSRQGVMMNEMAMKKQAEQQYLNSLLNLDNAKEKKRLDKLGVYNQKADTAAGLIEGGTQNAIMGLKDFEQGLEDKKGQIMSLVTGGLVG